MTAACCMTGLWNHDWWRCFTGWWIPHKLMLFLTFSLFSLQMRVRAGGRTVAGVGSVWSGKERAVPSVCARKAATLRLCPCVALTDVFMRTTASFTAPLACSGGEYIWSTAKTAFSKVRCMSLYVALQTRVSSACVCRMYWWQCICCFSKYIFQGIIFKEMFWVQFNLIGNVEVSYSLWMSKTICTTEQCDYNYDSTLL